MTNVRGWAHALLSEPTPLTAFASLNMPVLYLTGQHSPASSLGVARLLTSTLPNVEWVTLAGLGHMGPTTHPQVVNPLIETKRRCVVSRQVTTQDSRRLPTGADQGPGNSRHNHPKRCPEPA